MQEQSPTKKSPIKSVVENRLENDLDKVLLSIRNVIAKFKIFHSLTVAMQIKNPEKESENQYFMYKELSINYYTQN